MGLKSIGLIKPSNKAEAMIRFADILKCIENKFGKVSDKSTLKLVTSFILYVACAVEEAYSNKRKIENKKINKKDEVFKLISEFTKCNLNENEKKQISDIIEDLHSSGRIKKVSYISKSVYWLSSFFLNKN